MDKNGRTRDEMTKERQTYLIVKAHQLAEELDPRFGGGWKTMTPRTLAASSLRYPETWDDSTWRELDKRFPEGGGS